MKQLINLSINVLKVHQRNIEFFDDIEGEQYEKFKKTIREEGVIVPLTVSPDMTIISGHQRYKACKDIGIDLVPVIIDDALIEDENKLRKLLAANFGRLKNNPVKQGKVFTEYEKLCGVSVGRPEKLGQNVRITQEDIAKELGVDVRTIRRLKQLQTLAPELQQLIEDGSVKYTTALNVYSKLSQEEQVKLIEEIGKDKLASMTHKETQQYIDKAKQLENENLKLKTELQQEKSKPTKTEYEEKIIDNTDYTLSDKVKLYENKIQALDRQIKILEENKEINETVIKDCRDEVKEYERFKKSIMSLDCVKGGDYDEVIMLQEMNDLNLNIYNLLTKELAPIKYRSCMRFINNSREITDSFINIIEDIRKWCDEMDLLLDGKNKNNIINVEVI